MGLWKDRINAEIGEVSWDKRAVHDKIERMKSPKSKVKLPIIFVSMAALIFLLIFTNQVNLGLSITQSSNQEQMSLLQKIDSSNVEAYYYSVFKPEGDYYYGGIDDSYFGMKKGENIEDMQKMLSKLTVSEYDWFGSIDENTKDVVIHFDNGMTHKLRVSFYQIYDIEEQVVYDIGEKTYYSVFRGSLDYYNMFRWVNGYFLMLIGINLLLTSLARSPLREKFHSLFFIQMLFFIQIIGFVGWINTDGFLQSNFIFSKTVILIVYCAMTIIHLLLIYLLKLDGQLKRIEYYKMILYLVVSIYMWNKFFY